MKRDHAAHRQFDAPSRCEQAICTRLRDCTPVFASWLHLRRQIRVVLASFVGKSGSFVSSIPPTNCRARRRKTDRRRCENRRHRHNIPMFRSCSKHRSRRAIAFDRKQVIRVRSQQLNLDISSSTGFGSRQFVYAANVNIRQPFSDTTVILELRSFGEAKEQTRRRG